MTEQDNFTVEALDPTDTDAMMPIVIKTKKKKKFKYSKGLKSFQRSNRGVTKISSRLLKSIAKGMDTFRKESDKSAGKQRDGALLDLGLNTAKSVSKTLRASSSLPYDLAKTLDSRSSRKRIKRQIKAASRMARLMRIR